MSEQETAGRSSPEVDTTPLLETVEITTGSEPNTSVIWLHGLGADGHDFEPIVPALSWPGAPAIRYVFPHAPVRPVTINGGMPMRAWYDIRELGGRAQDQAGIAHSVAQVSRLLEREQSRGIDARRIVLAGFSQGGAIALQLALRHPQRLAGVMGLSTYLLDAGRLDLEAAPENRDLPVFIAHGTMDPVVPFSLGESAANALRRMGYPVDWKTYPMPHSVSPDEVSDITGWLRRQLG
jgi:phospholipase/carboxylesterase